MTMKPPEPEGHTANALRECVTNLALGKRVYYVIDEFQFARYCADMLRHIANLRGFSECRMKSQTEFALKNGGASLKFVLYGNAESTLRIRNINRVSDAVVFFDNNTPIRSRIVRSIPAMEKW